MNDTIDSLLDSPPPPTKQRNTGREPSTFTPTTRSRLESGDFMRCSASRSRSSHTSVLSEKDAQILCTEGVHHIISKVILDDL